MRRIARTLVDAMNGAPFDCGEGPIGRAVILLGIPMIVEMSMESVFAVTDIFFVGYLGMNGVATIGLTETLLTLVYTVAIGLAIGTTALVARRVGEHDLEGAGVTAVQAVTLGGMVSIVIAAIGVTFAPSLLGLLGGSAQEIRQATPYMRVMFAGNAVILLPFIGNGVLRGAGDATIAMRALIIANGSNLILVPCFVFGLGFFPRLGVNGAACATTLARGLGASYALMRLLRGRGRVKVKRRHFALHPRVMLRMIKLSGSGMLQIFVGTASWIGVMRVISGFGDEAVAGYTIGMRVTLFALFPAFGLGNAAATIVGQSLGARKPACAEEAVWIAGLYNAIFLTGMAILFVFFAPTIVGWFSADPPVRALAVACLRTVSCGFFFYAFGLVLTNAFNGAGDPWTPTLINLFIFWLFEIPAAYVLSSVLKLGPQGVFLAIALAFSALAVVSAFVFRRGQWKATQV
jgi:putative MATE family efflux protein